MSLSKTTGLVMGIHPTARGFGWILFEGSNHPVDWGIASAKGAQSSRYKARLKRLLSRYEPSTVVFEEFEGTESRRDRRIRSLYRSMINLAKNIGANTPIYGRDMVSECLTGNSTATRGQIAQAVAERVPVLRRRLPPVRKSWMMEDGRQCLFDAAALAITHFVVRGDTPPFAA